MHYHQHVGFPTGEKGSIMNLLNQYQYEAAGRFGRLICCFDDTEAFHVNLRDQSANITLRHPIRFADMTYLQHNCRVSRTTTFGQHFVETFVSSYSQTITPLKINKPKMMVWKMSLVYSFWISMLKSFRGCRLYQKIIQKYLATPRMLMISAAPMLAIHKFGRENSMSWLPISCL